MHAARIVGILLLLLTAGCGGVKAPAPVATPEAAAPGPMAGATAPAADPAARPSPPALDVSTQGRPAQVEPAPASATPPATTAPGQSGTAATTSGAKAPARVPAPPAPAAQAPKSESPAADGAKPKAPPLDVAALTQRLKDTKAIGVLTKIALKNQVDDLLNQFRGLYQGKLKTTLAELRQSYDLLILKVVALLQDGDSALATAVVTSREAIWRILSDPAKFAAL